MARFIINDLIYDTEKMEYIAEVRKWYEYTGILEKRIFGDGVGKKYDCKLYRSKRGNYFIEHERNYRIIGEAITKKEAKELLKCCAYEKYAELFGELEEA